MHATQTGTSPRPARPRSDADLTERVPEFVGALVVAGLAFGLAHVQNEVDQLAGQIHVAVGRRLELEAQHVASEVFERLDRLARRPR